MMCPITIAHCAHAYTYTHAYTLAHTCTYSHMHTMTYAHEYRHTHVRTDIQHVLTQADPCTEAP